MHATCDFCDTSLPAQDARNVALLDHLQQAPECQEQFAFMVENIGTSWTASMSGP